MYYHDRERSSPTAHQRSHVISIGEIKEGMARTVWEIGMDYAYDNPRTPVNLMITSDGGEVFEGFGVENAIRDIQGALAPGVPVIGVVNGNCFSMASYILQACARRIVLANSFIMVHGISQKSFSFDEKDGERNMALLKQLKATLVDGYARRSTQPREYWEHMMKDNSPNYFTAKEALDVGLVDEIRGGSA